ncbi:hypothetical protein OIU79_025608 [Salix purpurea]|uniref:Uncharacterized protein n=1 Tax=Salix purpurea TaxID=77065 RepID=A0A9Q1A7J9_SALPP|nr:hypothetical protein OIU79_025608 [Salix purpurea]
MGLNELEWLSLSDWTADGAKNFPHSRKSLATLAENSSEALSAPTVDVPPRIKFKRLDKTVRHIMQIDYRRKEICGNNLDVHSKVPATYIRI